MSRVIAVLLVVGGVIGTSQAYAQEAGPGPGLVEVSIIPGGGLFFTENTDTQEPSFGNYDLGGAFAYNFTRIVGVGGEVGGSIGIKQDLDTLSGLTVREKTPNMLSYTGNVIVNLPGHSVVPYATGGVGGLTMYQRELLAIFNSDTFLTGNVGGGVKWYAPNGRWGIRGEYRFQAVRSKDDAPAFFGQETRYGHRVYGGVILNVVK